MRVISGFFITLIPMGTDQIMLEIRSVCEAKSGGADYKRVRVISENLRYLL